MTSTTHPAKCRVFLILPEARAAPGFHGNLRRGARAGTRAAKAAAKHRAHPLRRLEDSEDDR
jgi:hypothetical protein